MKTRFQNMFFLFGAVVFAVMLTQLDYRQVWDGLGRAGYWFFAVIILWMFLYMFNTASWYVIIKSGPGGAAKINFFWLYKVTMSGFALNYTTPCGLMGGEPYRIMALSPKIGTERASSSVILYAMTHIFSHFIFWLLSILIYLFTEPLGIGIGVILAAAGSFCAIGVWFFLKGYRKGMAVRLMNMLKHVPGAKKWANGFIRKHKEQLDTIDSQIAALHNQNRKSFITAVSLEVACRFCSALEIMFVLLVLSPHASFLQSVLVLAFTSLFANLLFFLPLQLGGREGGFVMSTAGLAMSANAGIFIALIVRVRELLFTAVGLLLIKFEKKKKE